MAEWLNLTFHALDSGIFNAFNGLAVSAGAFFTPFFEFISFFGKKGIFFIAVSVLLMCFKKTRRTGLTILLAIGIGALFTNIIIKNVVARARPYTVDEFKGFWQMVGSVVESEKSFPSGHATVAMSAMTALFLTCNKKWSWIGFIFALLIGASRIYLVVHYFTDVFMGFIVGAVAALLAHLCTKRIVSAMEKNPDKKFNAFFINADIMNLFKKKTEE